MSMGNRILAIALIGGAALGGYGVGCFKADRTAMIETRTNAITYGCGGYEHDTGKFRWEPSENRINEEILQRALPPTPSRKPDAKKKG